LSAKKWWIDFCKSEQINEDKVMVKTVLLLEMNFYD